MALVFMSEGESYGGIWIAPLSWLHFILFEPLPWKVRSFDHIVVVCLILALQSADGRGPRVKPMRSALLLSVGSLAFWFAYGMATGGHSYEASFQTYLPMSGLLFAFAIATAFRTPEHYVMLAKALLVASAYRATMCCIVFLFFIRNMPDTARPEFVTSHDDTVLWVVCMLILILRFFSAPSAAARGKAFAFFLFIALAVLFNQRRVAWVSLAMALVIVFALLPAGKAKRRAMRALYALAPILAIYVSVGWGRSEKIFKPLQSFATVSTEEDNSTKARNMENLGLIATSNSSNLFLGTGWGHAYVEVSSKYSIAAFFKMWGYFPHNSILGMLGYTGVLGFFGYWLAYPTAMYLNARMARLGSSPLAQQCGIIGAASLIVVANQYYGDMGITYPKPVYVLSLCYALALRMPILVGAWPGPKAPAAPLASAAPAPTRAT
jgi:hypothetical protein